MRDKKRHFYVKWEEEVAGLCSCLYFIFSKVCTEELFQEKVLTCPGNRLFVCKQRSMGVPIFVSSSSSLFLPFLPSYLSALVLPIPAFVLSPFLLCCPLSIHLHSATPPNTFLTKQFLWEKPVPHTLQYRTQMGGLSPAVEDPHTHHTSTHHPIAQKPSQTTCCPI